MATFSAIYHTDKKYITKFKSPARSESVAQVKKS